MEHASTPSPERPADTTSHRHHIPMTGAECLAKLLQEWGTKTLFAYPGTSELALCEAVLRADGIEVVNARGDGEAVLLAGGANIAGRDVAACLLHGARGATNALGTIADLRRNEVPLIVVVGLPSSASVKFLPPHAEPGLISGLGHFAKSALELPGGSPGGDGGRDLISALRHAHAEALRRPCGPVLIGVPTDALGRPWLDAGDWPAPAAAIPDDGGSEQEQRTAASWLSSAQRAMVLLDDYALRYEGSQQALLEFARTFEVPLMQVRYDRGPMLFETLSAAVNPYFVSRYDPADSRHREILTQADLLVTVEDRNMYPRVVGPLASERHIAVTSAPGKAAINGYLRSGDIVLPGDIVDSLARLVKHAESLEGPARAARRRWAGLVRKNCAGRTPPPPARRRLASVIAAYLGTLSAPVLVDDSQMFGGLLAESYDLLPERLRVFGDHGGFVGAGLATAIGAALAHPQWDVVCCVGDSALVNGFKAWFSGVEQHVNLTCLVCNNGGSVSLRKQAVGDHGPDALLSSAGLLRNITALAYGDLCAALGVPYQHATWTTGAGQEAEQLAAALSAAGQADGPVLVEIQVPGSLEFWEGVWRLRGLDEPSGH
jgi:acetolactate synthase-1/2/3 large subunit